MALRRCLSAVRFVAILSVWPLFVCGCYGDLVPPAPPTQYIDFGYKGSHTLDDVMSSVPDMPADVLDVYANGDGTLLDAVKQTLVFIRLDSGDPIPFNLTPGNIGSVSFWIRPTASVGDGWVFLGFRQLPTPEAGLPQVPGVGYGMRLSYGHRAALRDVVLCGLTEEKTTATVDLSEPRPSSEQPHFKLILGGAPCAVLPPSDGTESYQCPASKSQGELIVELSDAPCDVCPEIVPASDTNKVVLKQSDATVTDGCLVWSSYRITASALAR